VDSEEAPKLWSLKAGEVRLDQLEEIPAQCYVQTFKVYQEVDPKFAGLLEQKINEVEGNQRLNEHEIERQTLIIGPATSTTSLHPKC
jgi:hypothetical protein